MITLNADKGMVRVENWDEIVSRPGFVSDLDPTTKQLKEIIGRYVFKSKVRCGLSNCHTPHGKGYIVTTTDGTETNIGKDCGKRYFGVDFEVLSDRFDEAVTAYEDRSALASFSFRIDALDQRIADLKGGAGGASWVNEKIKQLTTPGGSCPRRVIDTLNQMAKARSRTLTRAREATQREIEDLQVIEGRSIERPHYITVVEGEIAGIEVLYPENELRKLLAVEIVDRLDAFKTKDIDALSNTELRYWARWVAGLEAALERIAHVVELGRALLTQKNLAPLRTVVEGQNEQRDFRRLLAQLP